MGWLERFEGQLMEMCPDCEGWCDCCLTCMDEGLVPHACTEEAEDA